MPMDAVALQAGGFRTPEGLPHAGKWPLPSMGEPLQGSYGEAGSVAAVPGGTLISDYLQAIPPGLISSETSSGGTAAPHPCWNAALAGTGGRWAARRAALMLLGCVWLLAGTFVFFSQWTIWHGLFWIVAALLPLGWHLDLAQAWRQSGVWRGALLWVSAMLACSLMIAGTAQAENWLWGAAGLLAWLTMLHHTGSDSRRTDWLGGSVVAAASASALYSLVELAWLEPGWHWGMRLGNQLVYDGWNQVCSGVTYAFAAVWGLCLGLDKTRSPWTRRLLAAAHLLLVFTALATLSRGALLVLLAGHGLSLALAARRAAGGTLRLALVFALFHLLMPGLAQTDSQSPPETEVSRRYPRVIDGNPLREWTKRGATGRLEMYGAVWQTLREGGTARLLFGTGLWSDSALWNHRLPERERAPHPHSALVATALHGGLVGLGGLLAVLLLGLTAAWRAARQAGWPEGLVLAGAGLAGVAFDGQSLASLDTLPRFEPLLLWTGLLLAGGRCARAEA